MRHAFAWVVVCVTGCYSPSYKDCEVTCASGNGCPAGLTCDQALGACRTPDHGASCGSPAIDAPPGSDAAPDAPACWSILPTNFDPCVPQFPSATASVTLDSGTIDTSTGTFIPPTGGMQPFCMQYVFAGTTYCLARVQRLDVNPSATVAVTGSLPLLVVADGDININGTLDASHASLASMCPGLGGSGQIIGNIAGTGGGGGGYGIPGAPGGTAAGFAGGAPGMDWGMAPLSPLPPGCTGGLGASGNAATTPRGLRGAGGGAIELSSKTRVTVNGRIYANGGGGGGGGAAGGTSAGGGGGGSGGSVLLEAVTVFIGTGAEVCALGGGGGEGGSTMPGNDGLPPSGCTAGAGGSSANVGGDGGRGADTTAPQGGMDGGGTSASGGGGGGAVGRIRLHGQGVMPAGRVVPTAST